MVINLLFIGPLSLKNGLFSGRFYMIATIYHKFMQAIPVTIMLETEDVQA